jgi:hypothetical protein
MTEVILFIVFAIVLVGGYFLLRKIPKPTVSYFRIVMAIALLVLVWWDWDEKNKAAQYILTALAVGTIIKQFFELGKTQQKTHS